MSNYIKEKDIIKEVLKRYNTDWDNNDDALILKYLDPYIQDGFDVLVDDGYLLYLSDVRREMASYGYSCMTKEDLLKVAVANLFGDDAKKGKIADKMTKSLKDKFEGYAPEPKRQLKEYIQYSNCEKTKKEFDLCFNEYVKSIDNLKKFAINFLDVINSSIDSNNLAGQISSLIIFINKLEQLKDKEFFKSLTYESRIKPTELFYQEIFLSEDTERIMDEAIDLVMNFQLPETREFTNCSLEDIYMAIPKDVISYELLENENIDPDNIDYSSPFFRKFYHLAELLVKDADKDENFKDTVYHFLVNKIASFQKEFFDSYEPEFDQEIEAISYIKKY